MEMKQHNLMKLDFIKTHKQLISLLLMRSVPVLCSGKKFVLMTTRWQSKWETVIKSE